MADGILGFYIRYIENRQANDIKTNNESRLFTCTSLPNLSVGEYIQRLLYYNLLGTDKLDGTLLYSAVLLERMRNKGIIFNKITSHKLVLISIILASKLYDDEGAENSYWANIGGVSLVNLNKMEFAFIKQINHNLFITEEAVRSISRMIIQLITEYPPQSPP